MKFCGRGYWLRMLGVAAAAALLVLLVFGRVTWGTPWPRIGELYAVDFVFSICICPLIALAMPIVAPTARRRFPFPLDWAIMAAAIALLAIAGSILAIAILTAFGYIPRAQAGGWLAGSLRISVITALTFGIFVTALETMRSRLDQATLALRTKERDEAEARQLAAQAQLASLESRVRPHFLFNTLNTIAELIHADPAGAERMIGQLASLLRSSLAEETGGLIPLGDELQVVRDYLDIERVRFGDRLRYDLAIEEGVAAVRVPRLAVQTLVENSIKYAVVPNRAGASVSIRAGAAAGRARIDVADDGPGFAAGASTGQGLALLRSRLAAAYGGRAELIIDSRPGRTAVSILIPLA